MSAHLEREAPLSLKSSASGRVAFVEVAKVGVDARDAFREALDGFGPGEKAVVLRALDGVEARQVARAHPAYVNEVGGRALGQMPVVFGRNPLAFDERQRDVVLGEKVEDVFCEPVAAAKLYAEMDVARQSR